MILYGVRKSHLLAQPHHALAARATGKIVNRHHGCLPLIGRGNPLLVEAALMHGVGFAHEDVAELP
jgi:hypothetical protein